MGAQDAGKPLPQAGVLVSRRLDEGEALLVTLRYGLYASAVRLVHPRRHQAFLLETSQRDQVGANSSESSDQGSGTRCAFYRKAAILPLIDRGFVCAATMALVRSRDMSWRPSCRGPDVEKVS